MGEPRNSHSAMGVNGQKPQGSMPRVIPRANFLAAANYMKNFFEGKSLNWAVMGGLAMLCLGARRDMRDIHIVYEDRDFTRIKQRLESDPRVRLPEAMNSLFPTKLLLGTGPQFKDAGCTEHVEISVYLIPPGSHGAPPNDVLRKNQALLRLSLDGKTNNFKGLNIIYLLKTTIYYCKFHDLFKRDVMFLCQSYGREIESVRNQLNIKEMKENFLGTPFFSRLSSEYQQMCYQVLLGTAPPPTMSITPPQAGHGRNASSSDHVARPRIPSHKSSPSLNTGAQKSEFLTPPSARQPKARPAPPPNAVPSPPSAPLQMSTVPDSPPQPKSLDPAGQEPRSRYRPVSSAPNAPSASRNASPQSASTNFSRPKGAESNQAVAQSGGPSYKAQSLPMHEGPHTSKPHMASSHAPLPMVAQQMGQQKSMPNMKAAHGAIPQHHHGRARPPTMASGQPGAQINHGKRIQGPIQHNHARNASPGRSPLGPANHEQPRNPTTNPVAHGLPANTTPQTAPPVSKLRVIGSDGLHVPPPMPATPQSASDGNKGTTLPSGPVTQAPVFVAELEAIPVQSTIIPGPFIAELPADMEVSPSVAKPIVQQPALFGMTSTYVLPTSVPMNEAPVGSDMSNPCLPNVSPQTSPLMKSQQYQHSPVSPPAHVYVQPQAIPIHHQTNETPVLSQEARPLSAPASGSISTNAPVFTPPQTAVAGSSQTPVAAAPAPVSTPPATTSTPPTKATEPQGSRNQSPPREALPASLMIGGPRGRSPSNSVSSQTRARVPSTQPDDYTFRYQRSYSPPSSSPQPGPTSVYKAYPGTHSPSPPAPSKAVPAKLPLAHAPFQPIMPATPPYGPAYGPLPGRTSPGANIKETTLNYRVNPLMAHPPTPGSPPKGFDAKYVNREETFTMIPGAMPYVPAQQANASHQPGSIVPFGPSLVQQQQQQQQHQPGHQRNSSNDSTTSQGSEKLAQEYQLELPDFEQGYGNGSLGMSPPLRQVEYGRL